MNDPNTSKNNLAEPVSGAGVSSAATSESTSEGSEMDKLRNQARDKSQEMMRDVKEGARESLDHARDWGHDMLRDRQKQLASKMEAYTEAVRAAAETLEAQDNRLAGASAKAAERLERVCGYVRDTEPEEILDDLSDFTRRRPEIVFGTLFLAGLTAARFLKASSRRPRQGSRKTVSSPTTQPVHMAPSHVSSATPASTATGPTTQASTLPQSPTSPSHER